MPSTTENSSAKNIWKRDKLIYGLLIVFGAAMVFIAATISPTPSQPQAAPQYSAVQLPVDYKTRFNQYATVQRPDGTIRNLYIDPDSEDYLRNSFALPSGTIIVIEGYYALKNAAGEYLQDSDGRYVLGEPFEMIHVLEKRNNWSEADFVDDNRIGEWNFGSFDTKTGKHYNENMSACFHCHSPTSRTDFLYSASLLGQYLRSGQVPYFFCDLPDRIACDS
ncbi:MAG: cytochrome P460 family protein [Chloroflexota bacterium]